MIIDMHVHTIYSRDSLIAPEDLIERMIDIGLDAVCVMEHDSMIASRTAEEFAEGTPVKIFRGVEASTDLGHLLIYGVSEEQWQPYEGKQKLPAQELIEYVRSCNGVCVPAHPFRFKSPGMGEKIETLIGIFAIEGYNGKADIEDNRTAWQMAERLNLKMIGGSDAHLEGDLGKCVTEFSSQIETMKDLVEELKSGRFTAKYLW